MNTALACTSNWDKWSVLVITYNCIRVHLFLGNLVDFFLVVIYHLWAFTFVNDPSDFISPRPSQSRDRIFLVHFGAFTQIPEF